MTDAPFVFDGDDLALDLLNTRRLSSGRLVDVLASPALLAAWLREAGAATDADVARLGASPPEARLLLDEARRLRDAVAEAVAALKSGTLVPERAVLALDRVLAARAVGVRLEVEGAEARLVDVVEARGFLGLLSPVALAAARLVAGADPAKIRQCAHDDCVLWFHDTSKNGRRRWCSMARCGNRAKVAAHYRRKKRDA